METADDGAMEDIFEGEIKFPPEVQLVLDEVFPSDEPLEQANFNVVDYINSIFPTEQSLANIDEVVLQVENRITDLNTNVKQAVRQQTSAGAIGQKALEEAQVAIKELFAKIKNIKDRAEQSEQMVEEITRDIKQLDIAKRNLTQAITTHNHLHMLISGADTLTHYTQKKEFGEAAGLLQGVLNVMEQFDDYKSIDTIRDLSRKVKDLKQDLTRLVLMEFESAFSSSGGKNSSINLTLLRQACEVADVLEPSVKRELLSKFVKNQLSEYLVLFDASQEASWLDKIDRRYAWVKRVLVNFEEKFAQIFPKHWEVSERIAVEFCRITSRELNAIMKQRSKEIDVKLLLFAIQRTTNFENLLSKRLSGVTLRENLSDGAANKSKPLGSNEESKKTQNSTNPFLQDDGAEEEASSSTEPAAEGGDEAKEESPFLRLISNCFEPFLYIYIESQDRNLLELLTRFEAEFKVQVEELKSGKASAACEGGVLGSCADLFVYYKKCMLQCSQLSTSEPLVALANIFQKYLREYASKILLNNLPKISPANSQVSISGNLSLSTVTNLLLKDNGKDSQESRLNDGELTLACSILTTADYCLDTVNQLEEKLREKVDGALKTRINLTEDKNAFSSVISGCIHLLVQDLQLVCDAALSEMPKQSWTSLEHVGDQSSYVTAIESNVKQTVPTIRSNLSSARKYFTQFCIKFANAFVPRFVSNLCKCKPIGTVGAEQLLLDAHSLKTLLLELPSIGSKVARKAPSSYTKIVVKGMTKAEMLLKVVMTPHEPTSAFVSSCMRMLQDLDQDTIQKVVDMKGLRKIEQGPILEAFRKQNQSLDSDTSSASPARSNTNHNLESDSTFRIRKLEKLIKKRL